MAFFFPFFFFFLEDFKLENVMFTSSYCKSLALVTILPSSLIKEEFNFQILLAFKTIQLILQKKKKFN